MATTTGTFQFFDDGKIAAARAIIDDLDGTPDVRVLLLLSTYTFDATDEFVSDLTPGTHEVTAGGYVRKALSDEAGTEPTAGVWMLDSTGPVWSVTSTNLVCRRWVLYNYNASDAAARLIASGLLDNADADVTTTVGNDLTVNVDANGWYRLS